MTIPRGERNIARWLVWLALAYVMVTGGLLAALLLQLRVEAVTASKRELSAFAQLTAGHMFEVALGIEDALKLVDVTLTVASDSGAGNQESIGPMLRDVAAGARGLRDIFVLDARGRVVFQASGRDDIGLDRSDRPYFVQYQKNAALKFDIGAPVLGTSQAAAGWFAPATHVWRKSNGEFAGVIVGMLEPQFFDRAWTFDSEIEGLSIALTAADGTLVMRRPFVAEMMGRSLVGGPMASELPVGRTTDTIETRSPFDGQDQLLAYRRVAAYPDLMTFVAQPMDVVLAGWRRIAWIAGSSWIVASLALGGLGVWLARVMKVRGALQGRYRALFDSIPYPVIVSDNETLHILAFNKAAEQQYGWAAGDDLDVPEDFAVLAGKRQEFTKDAAIVLQGQLHRNKDGKKIDVEMAVRLIDYDGRPAALTIAVDVSDRLQAERDRQTAGEQLRHSQKMDLLGQLTSGIAHDFNNILMVIIANIESLTERGDVDPEALRQLNRITDSARRAEDLTRQMLAFSRKQPLRSRPTNINDLVAETGKLMRRTLGEQIEIDSILADDLWTVEVDRAQLETALVNLCVNARDAMPAGGRLLIETENVTLGKDDIVKNLDAQPGPHVLVTVSDTGRGILPKDLDKVFEPFFSTKEGGRGSGLGLSMVYGFIKQSNGGIIVCSEIDQGSSFKLYLPRLEEVRKEAATEKSAPVVGGTERVLVVEDDPQVRASVVRQLQSLGYAVSQAADGTAGVACFETMAQPYDLLLTDVVMPGLLNGKALADETSRRWPNTQVVFMSGYTGNALLNRGQIDADVRLLNKPFRKTDLAKMIRRALDSNPAPALT